MSIQRRKRTFKKKKQKGRGYKKTQKVRKNSKYLKGGKTVPPNDIDLGGDSVVPETVPETVPVMESSNNKNYPDPEIDPEIDLETDLDSDPEIDPEIDPDAASEAASDAASDISSSTASTTVDPLDLLEDDYNDDGDEGGDSDGFHEDDNNATRYEAAEGFIDSVKNDDGTTGDVDGTTKDVREEILELNNDFKDESRGSLEAEEQLKVASAVAKGEDEERTSAREELNKIVVDVQKRINEELERITEAVGVLNKQSEEAETANTEEGMATRILQDESTDLRESANKVIDKVDELNS